MKKKLILLICLALTACAPKEKTLYSKDTLQAGFDTIISIKLYTENQEEFDQVFSEAASTFLYYNNLFDKYNNYEGMNNIKTINDAAGKEKVEVDQELIDLLLLSKKYSEYSNNQFDITLGPVLSLWHDVREKAENGEDYTLPSDEDLKQAKVCTGWDKVEIDDENNTVYLNQSCASLDVGAVAKGYATQIVSQMLIQKGYVNGFVNAGGNVSILGSKANGDAWKSGILSPTLNNSQTSLVQLDLSEEDAFVTSGDYQRYFIYDNQIMHHIIDPDTLYPARHAKSVTILTKDSAIADILSTTLFTMTYEEGMQLIQTIKEKENISLEVVWIYDTPEELANANAVESNGFYIAATPNISEVMTVK